MREMPSAMVDLSDLKHHRSWHRPALDGRELVLKIETRKSGIVTLQFKLLADALKAGLKWHNKAQWVELHDFEGKTLLTRNRFARLWRAATGEYGEPTTGQPYTVRGPTINPTFMEKYWTTDLIKALEWAVWWQSSDDDPYWVEVRGPNRNIILSRCVIKNLYYATARASGRRIVHMLIQASLGAPPKILEERVIA